MKDKSTDILRQELMDSVDINDFLNNNEEHFYQDSVAQLINQIFLKKNMSKAQLAKQSGISEIYLHRIFSGLRKPSRDRLICLCFGLSATLDEAQELLTHCGYARLHPKIRRDAIILYGLLHGNNLFEINHQLFDADEEPLC